MTKQKPTLEDQLNHAHTLAKCGDIAGAQKVIEAIGSIPEDQVQKVQRAYLETMTVAYATAIINEFRSLEHAPYEGASIARVARHYAALGQILTRRAVGPDNQYEWLKFIGFPPVEDWER